MKILNLIIKQIYFDEILAGTKKQEFREVKPTTSKKYIMEGSEDAGPIIYYAIRFYVGYNKIEQPLWCKLPELLLKL